MSRKFDSSPARLEVSSWAAPKATVHSDAELAVDLVAHHDLQAEPLGQVVHATALVKPVREVLMLTAVAEPPSTSRVTSAGVGTDSSAMKGTSSCWTSQRRPSTSSAGHSSSAKVRPEVGHVLHRAGGLRRGPAAVAVDVQLDAVAESLAQGADDGGVEGEGRRPTFTLKVVMP